VTKKNVLVNAIQVNKDLLILEINQAIDKFSDVTGLSVEHINIDVVKNLNDQFWYVRIQPRIVEAGNYKGDQENGQD